MSTTKTTATEIVSVGRRLTDLAAIHPDKAALIFSPVEGEDVHVSYSELDRRSSQSARYFADLGVDEDSTIVIGLPNCLEHVISSYGAWKLGATVLPLRWDMPARELNALLELALSRPHHRRSGCGWFESRETHRT